MNYLHYDTPAAKWIIRQLVFHLLYFIPLTLWAQSNTPTNVSAPTSQAPVAIPAAYPSSIPLNFVRTWEPSMPSTDPAAVSSTSRSTADVKQTTQYFDGLGRSIQTVTKAITPAGKDLVAPVIYDNFGREVYQYLPYPQETGNTNDGKFKTDPFHNQTQAISNQNLYPGEQIYYSQTVYEASPLNRVLKKEAPGNSWAGSGRGAATSYEINTTADSVRIWIIAAAIGSLPTSTTTYGEGELYKNVSTDEAGNRNVEFKDKEGRVILRRVAMSTNAGDGHTGWLCTYYVYDSFNNLRFVISPTAVEYLQSHSWALSQSIADELCFRYEYDGRARMIIKKVPGMVEAYMVYDKRDRVVFTQDGNQRTAHQWLITYYDAINRPVETGIYTSSNATRTSLQTLMDGTTGSSTDVTYSIPAPSDLV